MNQIEVPHTPVHPALERVNVVNRSETVGNSFGRKAYTPGIKRKCRNARQPHCL